MFKALFNTTLNVSPAELIGTMCFGSFLTLALVAIILGTKWMRATREVAVPAEPVAVPAPAVEVVEVVMQRQPDLLPMPLAEVAPIFQQMIGLPRCDSIDWRFAWKPTADPYMTGSFPEIQREMDDDSVVAPVQLPGFEIDSPARSQFPRLNRLEREAVEARLSAKGKAQRERADLIASVVSA